MKLVHFISIYIAQQKKIQMIYTSRYLLEHVYQSGVIRIAQQKGTEAVTSTASPAAL
jgi:hypothetical protein